MFGKNAFLLADAQWNGPKHSNTAHILLHLATAATLIVLLMK
jgi:hypothetical protein